MFSHYRAGRDGSFIEASQLSLSINTESSLLSSLRLGPRLDNRSHNFNMNCYLIYIYFTFLLFQLLAHNIILSTSNLLNFAIHSPSQNFYLQQYLLKMGMPFWTEPEVERPSLPPTMTPPPPTASTFTEARSATSATLTRLADAERNNERITLNPLDLSFPNSPVYETPHVPSILPPPLSAAGNTALYSDLLDYFSSGRGEISLMSRTPPETNTRLPEYVHEGKNRESERAMLGRLQREELRTPELRSPSSSSSERSLSGRQQRREPRTPPGAPLRSPSPSQAPSRIGDTGVVARFSHKEFFPFRLAMVTYRKRTSQPPCPLSSISVKIKLF